MPVASTSKLPPPTLRDYTYIRLSNDDEEPPSKPVPPPQPIVYLPTLSPSAPVTITAPPPPVSTLQPSRPATPDPSTPVSRSTSPGPGPSTRNPKCKVKACFAKANTITKDTESEGATLEKQDQAYLQLVKQFVQEDPPSDPTTYR